MLFLGTDSAYNMHMSMNNKQHIKGGSIMTNENINNREQWLLSATDELKALFKQAGETVPNDVKVSCGFPLGFRAGSKHQAIGVCHPRSHSESGVNEIFINPNQDDSLRVLDVLVHELIHAIDDCQSGHGAPFRRIALAVGLTGKMTATVASPELEEKLKVILEKLGEYPHAKIQAVKKKQSTRMIKHVSENDCGAIIYASRKQSEENPMMCANCTIESEEPIYMVEA